MACVIGASRRGSAGVGEMPCESGPAVDLDQQVGQVDDRQLVGDLLGELVDIGLARLGPEPFDAEVALRADRHVGVLGLQVAIEHVAVTGAPLKQHADPFVSQRRQLELTQDAGSAAAPIGAGD